ncbi:hypothetical protein C7401_14647 [Paraburkholderia unamae]|nr:hypothetical protein C7401_14647 [Paraburkholderia unamae]
MRTIITLRARCTVQARPGIGTCGPDSQIQRIRANSSSCERQARPDAADEGHRASHFHVLQDKPWAVA